MPGSRDSFHDLYAAIYRNFLAVFCEASDVNVNGIADIPTRFLKTFSPSMATRKRRNIGVKSVVLIRLYYYSVGIRVNIGYDSVLPT